MIERLPTPWGLVRLGVAPDHPNIKAVSRACSRRRAAARLQVLRQRRRGSRRHARGARTPLQRGRVRGGRADGSPARYPGEDLPGSWAATELVAWYNGHPDFQELEFDLAGRRAIVIGNGNVALDVARMLALTRAELEATDTTEPAIEAIALWRSRRSSSSGAEGRFRRRGRRPSCRSWASSRAPTSSPTRPSSSSTPPARRSSRPQRRSFAATSTCCASSPRPRARWQAPPDRASVSSLASRARRGRSRGGCRAVHNRLVADGRRRSRRGDRRARDRACRRRLRQRRLPRCASSRPAVRRAARHPAERRRPRARRVGRAPARRLLRRVDQARPDRCDRDEQEGRDGDGGAPARGRAGCTPARPGHGGQPRGRARWARCRAGALLRLGGDRPGGARGGEPPRPAAREALT